MAFLISDPVQLKFEQEHTFTFNASVGAYLVGLSELNVSVSHSSGVQVSRLSVSLTSNLVDAASGVITVTAHGTLADAHGHEADASSTVTVSVLACDGEFATFGSAPGLANGATSLPITGIPPGADVTVGQATLNGFDFSYGAGVEHNVASVDASASSVLSGAVRSIQATAAMPDASGHDATATIDGGYICAFNNPEFEVAPWSGTGDAAEVTVPFTQPVKHAAAVMTSVSVSYGGKDHALQGLLLGCTQLRLDPSGKAAHVSPEAIMWDKSDHPHTPVGTVGLAVVGSY